MSRGFITVNMQDSVGVSFLRQITVNCREVSEDPGLRKELKRLFFFYAKVNGYSRHGDFHLSHCIRFGHQMVEKTSSYALYYS